jgi:FkbM family methyltransferase
MLYDKFHSQYGEDEFIRLKCGVPDLGVFVDVGAGHPIALNNTYHFERNGWSGLCVEADPRNIFSLKWQRKNVEHYAIVDTDATEVKLNQCGNRHLSTLGNHLPTLQQFPYYEAFDVRAVKVPATKLETLLSKHGIGKIDLLSIDTEGTELQVCNSFDWELHAPSVVIVEFKTCECPVDTAPLFEFFTPKYTLMHTTEVNLIFKRR